VLATIAILAGLIGLVSWRGVRARFADHPTQAQCAALLDRYVEHLTHAADPKPTPATIATQQAQARARAAQDPAFARCTSELTLAETECAMRADSADTFERCLQ
jgi:hypothetical protein